ncbi:VWA domain-containing protein [Mechercharimyces sp. CAU 1602]|uniref:vWA domain-containing protein n=1 Tax=Mechercharimyces sp. CAU 1602 TaxID=2973933 RepID=UPI002163104F|nr:VWA domain-containing protein [Mechercharimyces sp. CAU 1602]MCS1352676.1 VWA domain-containing protein [Mechercharimyces sp. CAU 1602]
MNRRVVLLVLVFILILSSGCSTLFQTTGKQSEQENVNSSEKKSDSASSHSETPPQIKVPTRLEDIELLAGPGSHSDQYDLNKVRVELDQWSKDLSSAQLYSKLLRLVGEDYRRSFHFFQNYDTSVTELDASPDSMKKIKVPAGQQVNVVILLDSSGSMAEKVEGGKKMDLAKKAVHNFISNMPQGANVSLQLYGHKGSNNEADKKVSCAGVEEVYPLGEYQEDSFQTALDKAKPTGYTPLAGSMESAKNTLSSHLGGANVQNIIYVVSDGVETCDGDPVKIAEELNQSGIQAVVNILGFDVDDKGQQALQKVADAGGGEYQTVDTDVEMKEYFEGQFRLLYDKWEKWADDQYNKAEYYASIKLDEVEQEADALLELINKEHYQLMNAAEYLEEERDFDYNVISSTKSKLYDRESQIKGWTYDARDYVQSEVRENRDEIQDYVRNQRDSEQRKLSN